METNNKFLYGVYAQGNVVRLFLSGKTEIDSLKEISNEQGYSSNYHRRIRPHLGLSLNEVVREYGQLFDDKKDNKNIGEHDDSLEKMSIDNDMAKIDLYINISHVVQLPVFKYPTCHETQQIVDGYMPMICIANPDNFKPHYLETIVEAKEKQRYLRLAALNKASKLYFGMHVNSIIENLKKNNIIYKYE